MLQGTQELGACGDMELMLVFSDKYCPEENTTVGAVAQEADSTQALGSRPGII